MERGWGLLFGERLCRDKASSESAGSGSAPRRSPQRAAEDAHTEDGFPGKHRMSDSESIFSERKAALAVKRSEGCGQTLGCAGRARAGCAFGRRRARAALGAWHLPPRRR